MTLIAGIVTGPRVVLVARVAVVPVRTVVRVVAIRIP
jgi:hypothetical protein